MHCLPWELQKRCVLEATQKRLSAQGIVPPQIAISRTLTIEMLNWILTDVLNRHNAISVEFLRAATNESKTVECKHLRMALCLLVKSYFRTFSPSAKIFSLSNLKFLSAAAILLFFNKGSSKRRLFTCTTVGWLTSEPWRRDPRLGRQPTTECDQIEWFSGLNPCACDELGLFVTSQLLLITNKPSSIVAVLWPLAYEMKRSQQAHSLPVETQLSEIAFSGCLRTDTDDTNRILWCCVTA